MFDSVPPDQLMADRSSEEDDEDLEITEAEFQSLSNIDVSDDSEDIDIEEGESNLLIDESGRKAKKYRKDKGAPRFTAFMLFAKMNRSKILDVNPGMDFSSISKKLGEMWSSLPNAQKAIWKRKLNKIGQNITEKRPQQSNKVVKIVAQPQGFGSRSTLMVSDQMTNNSGLYKVTGTQPIDAAAHLKLLGESLSVIGQRLTEHKGQIAVSGSLSVLLDSLLCAMGPLVCLTRQVPELQNAVPPQKMSKILDNIAYVMPGL